MPSICMPARIRTPAMMKMGPCWSSTCPRVTIFRRSIQKARANPVVTMPIAPTVPKKCSGAGHILEQKANRQQIEKDAEGSRDAVVAFACGPRGVRNRNFADGRTVPTSEGWNEAMHFSIERNVLDNLSPVCLEGGAEVVDVNTGQRRH